MNGMPEYTPDDISELKPNEVFIFGSNLSGNHGGGAAKIALAKFGAVSGIGEGLQGQSYAFPTLDKDMKRRSKHSLKVSRCRLYDTAQELPDHKFYLTKVGTGIAGYPEEIIRKLFINAPENIVKPRGW
jgi:hypothetical protein